jgi:starvation-inducible DNA-binding protein
MQNSQLEAQKREYNMSEIVNKLSILLADTYALYLKTQNYHWHVKGAQFKALHELFEKQYQDLADAVDEIAERILTLGHDAPATFKAYEKLKNIQDGNSKLSAKEMVVELAKDNDALVADLNRALGIAQKVHDEGTIGLLSDRVRSHEKARWMLKSSLD